MLLQLLGFGCRHGLTSVSCFCVGPPACQAVQALNDVSTDTGSPVTQYHTLHWHNHVQDADPAGPAAAVVAEVPDRQLRYAEDGAMTMQEKWGMSSGCGTDEQLVFDDALISAAMGQPVFVATATLCTPGVIRVTDVLCRGMGQIMYWLHAVQGRYIMAHAHGGFNCIMPASLVGAGVGSDVFALDSFVLMLVMRNVQCRGAQEQG